MRAVVLQPGRPACGPDKEVIGNIPPEPCPDIPTKIRLPGIGMTRIAYVAIPWIPIAGVDGRDILQLGLDILIAYPRSNKWRYATVDDVVVDVEASGLQKGVLLYRGSRPVMVRKIGAESRPAKHEIAMDAQVLIEVKGDAKSAEASVGHVSTDVTERAIEVDIVRVQVLANTIRLHFTGSIKRFSGPRNLRHARNQGSCQRRHSHQPVAPRLNGFHKVVSFFCGSCVARHSDHQSKYANGVP